MPPLLPWCTESSRVLLNLEPWFSILEDTVRLPSGRIVDDFYRIKAPDYVLVAAQREDGALLLERQFRQCLGKTVLTNPAGAIDTGEMPQAAAERELLEETGYKASRWNTLGSFVVDGTRGICTAHLFWARLLKLSGVPVINDMEECELVFMQMKDIKAAIRSGQIVLLPDIAILSMVLGQQLWVCD